MFVMARIKTKNRDKKKSRYDDGDGLAIASFVMV